MCRISEAEITTLPQSVTVGQLAGNKVTCTCTRTMQFTCKNMHMYTNTIHVHGHANALCTIHVTLLYSNKLTVVINFIGRGANQ